MREGSSTGKGLFGAMVLVCAAAAAHGQVTANWLTPTSDIWSNPVRWSTDPFFPNNGNGGNTYHAVIAATGAAYTVTLDQAITVDELTISSPDATLDLSQGFAFNTTGNWTSSGGATIDGQGTAGLVQVGGTLTIGDGTIRGISTLRGNGPVRYNQTSVAVIDDTGVDHGDGSAVMDGSGDIEMQNGASITNGPTSVFTFASDSEVRYNGTGAVSSFVNNGTMIRDTGAGTTRITDMPFQNNGTLEVRTGTFQTNGVDLTGNTLTGGTWVVKGGNLDLQGGSISTNAATVELAAGAGTFAAFDSVTANAAAGTIRVSGGRTYTLASLQNDGTVDVPGASTLTTTGTLQNNASVSVGPGSTLNAGSLGNISGTTMTGGQFDVQGTIKVPNGTSVQTLASAVTLDGAAASIQTQGGQDVFSALNTINTGGDLTLQNGHSIATTTPTFTVSGAGRLNIGVGTTFSTTGTFSNFSGGTFSDGRIDVDGTLQFTGADIRTIDSTLSLNGAGAQIIDETNQDAFRNLDTITPAGGLTVSDGRNLSLAGGLTQNGNLSIGRAGGGPASTLSMPGPLTQGGGTVDLFNNSTAQSTGGFNQLAGMLKGNGTLDAAATLGGSVGPGNSTGHLMVTGLTTFNAGSQFLVEIGGVLQGQSLNGYDWMEVQAPVQFQGGSAGTLSVTLVNGFIPAPGEEFAVLTYLVRNGEFADYQGLDLGGGLMLIPQYRPDSLVLVTILVPSPGVLGIAGLGLIAATRRRRR